jgi:rhodanese-related sulfurtransferase
VAEDEMEDLPMLNLFQRKPQAYAELGNEELAAKLRAPENVQLVDVRSNGEFARGHIKGARLMPLPDLAVRSRTLKPDQPVVVYCLRGHRSRRAAEMLVRQGFRDVGHLRHGISRWNGELAR